MNFLKVIKGNISDQERSRGLRGKVTVNTDALTLLINSHERMDSKLRFEHDSGKFDLNRDLRLIVEAHSRENGKTSEKTLLIVMDILKELSNENAEEKFIAKNSM